jgi:C1A family cysteine protease
MAEDPDRLRYFDNYGFSLSTSFSLGVYQHVDGKYAGNHAVKILGWGTENGTPYWLVVNSWGAVLMDFSRF